MNSLLEESKKRMIAFKSKSHRRMLNITYRQRKTNVYIHEENNIYIYIIGSYERVLQMVKMKKISWFCHVSGLDTLENIILHNREDEEY